MIHEAIINAEFKRNNVALKLDVVQHGVKGEF